MLKNINPLLNADVLHALCAMGHGDELVLCDANFPADAIARQTVLGKLLRLDGSGTTQAAHAILSVLPLDTAIDYPVRRMELIGEPHTIPPVQQELQHAIDQAEGRPRPMGSLERFAFYEAAKQTYCVIATSERRFYGCFLIKKGVLPPEL